MINMQNEQDTGLGLWVFQQYHGRQFFNGGDHSTQIIHLHHHSRKS